MRDLLVAVVATGLTALLVGGCAGGGSPEVGVAAPGAGVPTLTMLPLPPEEPPSGTILADLRQSSLDAAAEQAQVWLDNDTRRDLEPVRIVYSDPRLPRPVVATRLRSMPAQAERGFPLALPGRPRCGTTAAAGSGTVEVRGAGGAAYTVGVADEADVVGRYVDARCDELALRRVVGLSWAPTVDDGASDPGDEGRLVLRLRPTGAPGRVVVATVGGSHLLGSADGAPWSPDVVVRGSDGPMEVGLALRPARCDVHAFMEGGNATAFRVGYRITGPDGREGSLLLRMDAQGAANAIRFARESCGLE